MELTLVINGKEKIFHTGRITGRHVRSAIELSERLSAADTTLVLVDDYIAWICELYGNKFTPDEYIDGIDGDKYMSTLMKTANDIITGLYNSIDKLPKNA